MKISMRWLPAALLAVLLAPPGLHAAEGDVSTGYVEAGVASQDIKDDPKRVNEYSQLGKDDGTNAYGKVQIRAQDGASALEIEAGAIGDEDVSYQVGVDVARVLRGQFSFLKYSHWLDHDQIDYLDAGVRGTGTYNAANPLSPDNIPGGFTAYNPVTGQVTAAAPGPGVQQFGRATVYGEDFASDRDFSIIRREWQNDADLTIPWLPNLTFHAGLRVEEREGSEQSIGMSKCTTCHITGQGRAVDERTQDFTAGVSGRFGLLSFDYTYLDREFRERAAPPTRVYDPSNNPGANYAPSNPNFDNRITYDYESGALPYDDVPDSDKESHVLKARLDLPRSTQVSASLVSSEVTSRKSDEPDPVLPPDAGFANFGGFVLPEKRLKTSYDAYGVKAATKLGRNLTLTARARLEELESSDRQVVYQLNNPDPGNGTYTAGTGTWYGIGSPATGLDPVYHSVLSRDIATFGFDVLYRLGLKDTLRLGYEYQEIDREDEHFGVTESQTVKAVYKMRPLKTLSARIGYTYKNIDHPFQYANAALYQNPVTGENYFDKDGNVATSFGDSTTWQPGYFLATGPTYGVEFYDQRVADLSNQPETVHEAKVSATWSPAATFSGTLSYRYTQEENELDHSTWEQQTHAPSVTLWYAPAQALSFTLAYSYLNQGTESAFCQGWYDG